MHYIGTHDVDRASPDPMQKFLTSAIRVCDDAVTALAMLTRVSRRLWS